MSNPLFNLFGGMMQNTPFGNMMNMISQFQQFRQQFQGDPRQQVQDLLNSGRMSQQQYSQLQDMAKQFQQLLNTRR